MIRWFRMIPIAAMLLMVTVYAHAIGLTGGGGGGSAATPTPVPNTPTPTISVPTAVATSGHTLTLAAFGSPSYTTHDMIACCVENNNGTNTEVGGSNQQSGWFNLGVDTNGAFSSGTFLDGIGHCIQPTEPATYTLNVNNTAATQQACILLRNTSCGFDGPSTFATHGSSSTTITYPAFTTANVNEMLIYCSSWVVGASNVSMSTNPAGLTVDVSVTGVGSTSDGVQIGHIPQAAATTVASATGSISSAQNSGTWVGAVAPIH